MRTYLDLEIFGPPRLDVDWSLGVGLDGGVEIYPSCRATAPGDATERSEESEERPAVPLGI